MRRILGSVAGLLAVALALTLVVVWAQDQPPAEDTSSGRTPRPSASVDPGAQDAPEGLAEFYAQTIDWEECGDNDCATLTVPLDYAAPDGRTIDLALLRVPATGTPIGSLVVNPGGPGAPGTDYAAYGSDVFGDPLLEAYDIVGFDPRGTGDSSPIDCLPDAELSDFFSADPHPEADEVTEYVATVRAFGEACVDADPELARNVGTVSAARDMDVLRAALGESELDYLGASYGTELGATYAELFPERVGRFVLDGAVDPTLSNKALLIGQGKGFEGQLRDYVANCVEAADGNCFLGDSVDEGIATIQALLDEIDAEPLPTDTDRVLESGDAFYGIAAPLYSRGSWMALSTALKQALEGDGTTLLLFADLYGSRTEDETFTDNSLEANWAINCADNSESASARQVSAMIPKLERVAPTFGEALAWSLVGCIGFPPSEPPLEIDGSGAAPLLVVGTTRDPATPYEWALSLAEALDSAVLVTREGDGHTGYGMGNSCVDDAIHAFLIDGVVPDDGLVCGE